MTFTARLYRSDANLGMVQSEGNYSPRQVPVSRASLIPKIAISEPCRQFGAPDAMNQAVKPLFVGIAGGSGSGKTTICQQLRQALGTEQATVVSSDQYYRSLDLVPQNERDATNFDHPDAIEFDLLAEHLGRLHEGKTVWAPQYCFSSHTRSPEGVTVVPQSIMLIEGVLLYTHAGVREQLDLRLFAHASDQVRYQRRLERDTTQRGRSPESVEAQWRNTVTAMHDEFVEPSRSWAHLIVPTDNKNDRALEFLVAMLKARINAY